MKKVKYLLVALLFGVLLTGCGSSTKSLKCTNKLSTDTVDYKATYEIKYDSDNYVKEVVSTETVKSDDKDYLEQTKEVTEELYKQSNDTYGGYSYKVSISGNTLTAECTIDYSKMDVEKYVEETGLENFIDSKKNVLLSGVKQIYKELGATCE